MERCFSKAVPGELLRQLGETCVELQRNRAEHNRRQAAWARNDMRTWQLERRKRTRHLVELGGLVVKAGIVDLTNDDRATIFGALVWIAARLRSHEGERARELWAAKGKRAFDAERHEDR